MAKRPSAVGRHAVHDGKTAHHSRWQAVHDGKTTIAIGRHAVHDGKTAHRSR